MLQQEYDIVIIGGGLAGLSLSIQLARKNYKVALFERETYPFHKVCGEYISHESWNHLEELGVPLSELNLPQIQRLQVSGPDGLLLEHPLDLGGFGISRYMLDELLAKSAKAEGVHLFEGVKVMNVVFRNQRFVVFTSAGETEAAVCAGTFGKRSNLDVKWKRQFTQVRPNKLNHYVGVKYHIKLPFPDDLIALHNFENGYCGISRIEKDLCCLCYLTTAENLRKSKNDIREMEKSILMKNPYLEEIFSKASFVWEEPVTISRISFNKKTRVENHVLLIGDAAGLITPLCGNGMSMALHGSKLAAHQIDEFLRNKINRFEMEQQYNQQWEAQFGKRLMVGRWIQSLFGGRFLTNLFVRTAKFSPKFTRFLIRLTHGQPF